MSRVQKAPGVWVTEEPREAHLAHSGSISGRVIPDMRPIITMGGLKDMSRPSGARRSFRIRLETTRYPDGQKRRHEDSPRCGFLMKHAKEPCAKLPKHRDCHRTQDAIDREAGRKRDKYPRRMAA